MADDEIGGDPLADIEGFDWDREKAQRNFVKHGIDFDDAVEIFYGATALIRSDRNEEVRWIAVGKIAGRIISVVFTRRAKILRIISARRARKNEERAYRHKTMG
jgi:uncharacterized DUF497 family protein